MNKGQERNTRMNTIMVIQSELDFILQACKWI